MKPIREEVIKIVVTPKTLRAIADDLEQRTEQAKPGENIPAHAFYNDGLTVILLSDYEAFNTHKAGGTWK